MIKILYRNVALKPFSMLQHRVYCLFLSLTHFQSLSLRAVYLSLSHFVSVNSFFLRMSFFPSRVLLWQCIIGFFIRVLLSPLPVFSFLTPSDPVLGTVILRSSLPIFHALHKWEIDISFLKHQGTYGIAD